MLLSGVAPFVKSSWLAKPGARQDPLGLNRVRLNGAAGLECFF